MKQILIIASVLFFSAYIFGVAQTGGFVQEEPHEHGAASLSVVLEGETLNMEFVSPAVNLVGFEYEPATPEEEEAVTNALAQLEDGATLFAPAGGASCELSDQEVEREVTSEDDHEEGEEHSDEEGGEETGGEGAVHSEFHATYTFTCAQTGQLGQRQLAPAFRALSRRRGFGRPVRPPGWARRGGTEPDDERATHLLRVGG